MSKSSDSEHFGAPPDIYKKMARKARNAPPKPRAARAPRETARGTKPVMVMLSDAQVVFLDRISASIREKSGRSVKRAALLRAVIDALQEQDAHRLLEVAASEEDVKNLLKAHLSEPDKK